MPVAENPEAASPSKVLRGGEFFSPVKAHVRSGDVLLSELYQSCSRAIPRHEHELAYVTIMLNGNYMEGDRGRLEEVPPLSAVFNPVGATHSSVIGPGGAYLFTVEFRSRALSELDLHLPTDIVRDQGIGAMLWPGLRVYSAFQNRRGNPLVLESCILEMMGAIARFEPSEKTAPRWFRRVKERLHAEFRLPLRMQDLARDAGVHPVHLARVFRRMESQTPGEYQQRLQVHATCELLRDLEWPLAAIAAECGFADQSHFTRIFRRMAGMTPARFRAAVSGRKLAA